MAIGTYEIMSEVFQALLSKVPHLVDGAEIHLAPADAAVILDQVNGAERFAAGLVVFTPKQRLPRNFFGISWFVAEDVPPNSIRIVFPPEPTPKKASKVSTASKVSNRKLKGSGRR